MKNFTLLLAGALFTTTTSFAQPQVRAGRNFNQEAKLNPSSALINRTVLSPGLSVQLTPKGKVSNISAIKKLKAKLASSSSQLITSQPEGTLVANQLRSGLGYYAFYGYLYKSKLDGAISNYVVADNALYLKNPFSQLVSQTWLKLDKVNDSTYVADFQPIYDNQGTYLYAAPLKYKESLNSWSLDTLADGTVNTKAAFRYNQATKSLKQIDEYVIGLVDMNGGWYGYGDEQTNIVALPEQYQQAVVSQDIKNAATPWTFTYWDTDTTTATEIVSLAHVGNKFYIRNPYNKADDEWIIGQQNGNTAEFKDQYLGPDSTTSGYHLFYYPTTYTTKDSLVDDGSGNYQSTKYDVYEKAESQKFTWDESTKTLTAEKGTSLLVNAGFSKINTVSTYNNAVIKYFQDVAAVPADPTWEEVTAYNLSNGYGYFSFEVFTNDVDGNFINPEKLHYRIFKDGDTSPLVFYSDDYTKQNEAEKSDFAYDYNDGWDIYSSGKKKTIYYYFADFDSLGVQALYNGGGEEHKSSIVWYTPATTGINNALTPSGETVKSEAYYDLSGRLVARPASGVFIKKSVLTNGTKKVIKVIR